MEFCKRCGQGVLVQIQKGTGYCTPVCEAIVLEDWDWNE